MTKPNVCDKSIAEEGIDAMSRAIDELVRDNEIQRTVFFLQGANGGQRNDALDTKLLQTVYVGAVVQLRRHEAMSTAMAGQEGDLATGQRSQDVSVRRLAEWGVKRKLTHVGQARHGVKTASADDANFRVCQSVSFLGGKPTIIAASVEFQVLSFEFGPRMAL